MRLIHRYPLRASLAIMLILTVFSMIVYLAYKDFRENEFHNRLRNGAISRQEMFFEMPQINIQAIHEYDLKRVKTIQNLEYLIYTTTGKTLYHSPYAKSSLTKSILNRVLKQKEYIIHKGDLTNIYFFYYDEDGKNSMILEVTGSDTIGIKNQNYLKTILFYVSLFMVLVAGVGFSLLVRRDLKPLGLIMNQINDLSDKNLHLRLPQAVLKDEFGQMAKAFNALLDRIEAFNSQQRNFVSYSTHELRTPLTIIQGQAEVTLMKERTKAEYKETLTLVKNEIQETIQLVNDLLELARANADAHLVDFQAVRIDENLWHARSQLLQKRTDYQIIIEFGELLESEEQMIVNGNASLLKQAFINLMENACKYSDNKTVNIKIEPLPNSVEIKLMDTGQGISEEELMYIFEPFYRANNTSSVHGHGIGLPLTKKIIQLHEGKCLINSKLNFGTTMTIILPLKS